MKSTIEDNKIIPQTIPSVEQMKGFIKTKRKKPITKAEMKKAVIEGVLKKFERKQREGRY